MTQNDAPIVAHRADCPALEICDAPPYFNECTCDGAAWLARTVTFTSGGWEPTPDGPERAAEFLTEFNRRGEEIAGLKARAEKAEARVDQLEKAVAWEASQALKAEARVREVERETLERAEKMVSATWPGLRFVSAAIRALAGEKGKP